MSAKSHKVAALFWSVLMVATAFSNNLHNEMFVATILSAVFAAQNLILAEIKDNKEEKK